MYTENWPDRVGFIPCSLISLPSICMKLWFCCLWGTVEKHFKLTSGAGSHQPKSRAGSICTTNRCHTVGVTEVHLLLSCSLVSLGSHTPAWRVWHSQPQPGASHQPLPTCAQLCPASSVSLLPWTAQGMDTSSTCTFTLVAKIMRGNTQEHLTTCLLPEAAGNSFCFRTGCFRALYVEWFHLSTGLL